MPVVDMWIDFRFGNWLVHVVSNADFWTAESHASFGSYVNYF